MFTVNFWHEKDTIICEIFFMCVCILWFFSGFVYMNRKREENYLSITISIIFYAYYEGKFTRTENLKGMIVTRT